MSVTTGPLGPEPTGRCLVVVAGVPGAGKSTLLAGWAGRGGAPAGGADGVAGGADAAAPAPVVLDSDPLRLRLRAALPARVAYRWYRPLVHLWHRLRILRAALGPTPTLLVHLPATWGYTRWWLGVLAAVSRRRPHLVWVDVDPDQARRGQHRRGRLVAGFGRHARRGTRFAERLRAGHRPAGWTVTVVDRRPPRSGRTAAVTSMPAVGPVVPAVTPVVPGVGSVVPASGGATPVLGTDRAAAII